MKDGTKATQAFYDEYWPRNVPDYQKTREHVLSVIPDMRAAWALDAGCGTGVCSLALAERANGVVAIDISAKSLEVASRLAEKLGRENIDFGQADLLSLPFADGSFDLIYSWGAIDHTVDPIRALDEIVRVLKPEGVLVLAVYLKTRLTPLHELSRTICLRLPGLFRPILIKSAAVLVRAIERFKKLNNVRDDNPLVESQVEDWFFAPEKRFFSIEEMKGLFEERGLRFELLCERTGRFKSSSDFIARGVKESRPYDTGEEDTNPAGDR